MPLYTRETLQTDKLPWVEIDDFEFLQLGRIIVLNDHSVEPRADGTLPWWGFYHDSPLPATARIEKTHPKQRLVVLSGEVQVESAVGRVTLHKRDYFDIPEGGANLTNIGTSMAEIGHVLGHWKNTIRNEICMFRPENPCDYHYHDGDEYWVIFRGHFTLDYNGRKVPVGPGTLLAAGAGYEHGALAPEEVMNGIVMAMPLEGQERDGHLNREKNGDPVPKREVPDSVWAELDARSVNANVA